MADVVDQAQERIEREESYFVARAKANAANMKGEPDCRKYGESNDPLQVEAARTAPAVKLGAGTTGAQYRLP